MNRLQSAAGAWQRALFGPMATMPGEKRPHGTWRQYQAEPAPLEHVTHLLNGDGQANLGLVLLPGQECIDVEGRAVADGTWSKVLDAAAAAGLDELLTRVMDGYLEATPSGGLHILWWCNAASGNQKLACRPTEGGEEPLIETRGPGGFVVVAPSPGWEWQRGAPHTIAEISVEERDDLLALFRAVDERVNVPASAPPQPTRDSTAGLRPGDDFNARATWEQVLEPHGWTKVNIGARGETWRRPGKDRAWSATTNATGNDTLHVHSTSTPFNTSPTSYSKFSAYALLEHAGDHHAAALELARQGYGDQRDTNHAPDVFAGPATTQATTDETGTDYWGARTATGGTFILDTPPEPPALWGGGQEVLWAEGEALMLCGPAGVGKTTLAVQLVAGRIGLHDSNLLGLPVASGNNRVLYLAMDRPPQISRAMGRLFTSEQRHHLDDKLIVWKGPLPYDLAKRPETLLKLCELAQADTVVVDSLKDAVLKLSDDESGGGYNKARQAALANGVQVIEMHHQRKAGAENKKPTRLDDVYGSTWLTAGAGSVLLLWGEPGDPVVELMHLKQPAEPVGPLMIEHDHVNGRTSVRDQTDLLDVARWQGAVGLTAQVAAQMMFMVDKPTGSQVEKARRKLKSLANGGRLHEREVQRQSAGGKPEIRYYLPTLEVT